MADEGTIEIGATTLDTPIGYTHDPKKLESDEYSIGGTLLTTRIVTEEDQPKNKYLFRVSGIINSKMLAIKAEVAHIGNLDYIDNLQIVEVLSGDGTTRVFYTQRRMSGATPLPTVTVGVTDFPVTVNAGDDPPAGEVYAKVSVIGADGLGRARFTFKATEEPADIDNNIIIEYEPKFYVRIPADGFIYTGRIANIANYLLICKEV